MFSFGTQECKLLNNAYLQSARSELHFPRPPRERTASGGPDLLVNSTASLPSVRIRSPTLPLSHTSELDECGFTIKASLRRAYHVLFIHATLTFSIVGGREND